MSQQPMELILLRELASSLAVPVFLVDERGDLAFLNEAAEQLLGIRFDDIDALPLGTWATAFQPRGLDGTPIAIDDLPLVRAVASRMPAHGPLLITSSDGQEREIEVTAFPLEGGRGRLLGGVAMFWERQRR